MKKFILIFAVLILVLVFAARRNSDPSSMIQHLTATGGAKAAEIKYRIYAFGVIPVAEASFSKAIETEFEGRRVYRLSAKAESLKFLERLFSASAILDSYLDTRQLYPLFFTQRISLSGKPEITRRISYNQAQGVMTTGGVQRQIPAETHDPLSLLFNLRRADLQIAQKMEFNINTNQKNYIFAANSAPKEMVIAGQPYPCAFLKADIRRSDEDNPYHRSKVSVLFLRSREGNIPVLIKIFSGGFLAHIKLIEAN